MDINLKSWNQKKEQVKNFIDTVLKTNAEGVVIVGPAGCGKSSLVYESIKDINPRFVPTHCTAKHLFHFLKENSDVNAVAVLDDSADAYKDKETLSIQKCILDRNASGKRLVTWQGEGFEFLGKVVFVTNDERFLIGSSNQHLQPLRSRLLTCEYGLTFQEMKAVFRHIIEQDHQSYDLSIDDAKKVSDWVGQNVKPSSPSFDLRLIKKSAYLYKQNPYNWQNLLATQVGVAIDPHYEIIEFVLKVAHDNKISGADEVRLFTRLCQNRGLSGRRSTYFEKKKLWFTDQVVSAPCIEEIQAVLAQNISIDKESPEIRPFTGKQRGRTKKIKSNIGPATTN
jgi:GTPase SAR1 family protein